MTPREVSEMLGCTVNHVTNLIVSGKLPADKVASECNQHGYVYNVLKRSVKMYLKFKKNKGWPAGKKRGKKDGNKSRSKGTRKKTP